MTAARWEHFDHDADIGVRGIGPTKRAAFEQAALGLTAVVTNPRRVRSRHSVPIQCDATDDELLLADWLNAVTFEMATRRMLFGRFQVDIVDGSLRGHAWGETVDAQRHEPATEVKGATLTDLRVREGPPGTWVAQSVVDV